MATNLLQSYGKIDHEAEQARLQAQRRSRKRITIIVISSLLLLIIVLASFLGTQATNRKNNRHHNDDNDDINKSLAAVCGVTLYKDSCYESMSSAAKTLRPNDLFHLSLQVAITAIHRASQHFSQLHELLLTNHHNATAEALTNCMELLALASDHLNDTSLSSSSSTASNMLDAVDDLRTWLSSAATYQDTCIEGLREANMTEVLDDVVEGVLRNSTELTSNSLAIVTWMEKVAEASSLGRGRGGARRLLEDSKAEVLGKDAKEVRRKADAVVAKDGSGDYKTIGEALKAVPEKSKKKRFVIYVKKGVYKENVRVEKKMWNVVMVGDGMDATVVTGSRNVVDGTPTFSTATFAVFGKGFVARDMGFTNTAGPAKHQAVALMCNGDMSVFYRCSFDAFQDTLYAHANRQFYRECNISGTVDFIFGNSAVVIQNSNILPKVPKQGQKNTITAQGKTDPNQNTGIVVQNCNILPYKGNWKGLWSIKNFLGRPWKDYSTTVFMRSMIGNIIDPTGWLPWTGTTAPPTIYYAEYENYGAGASTKNRVKWKGVKSMDKSQAGKFSVKAFIQGDKWIENSGVGYK